MTSIARSALVSHSAEKMYALVDDILSYPKFLPWCKSTAVHKRDVDSVRASIEISKAGINKSFTTVNRLQNGKMIEIRLVEGPFSHLEGYWRFDALSANACKVSLDIEFEFSSKILSMTVGPIFGQICNSLVQAFVKRAQDVYGRS